MNTAIHWHHHVLCAVSSQFGFEDRVIDQHILWFLTDGHIGVSIADRSWELGPGALLWVPPRIAHSVALFDQRKTFTCYSFRFEYSNSLTQALVLDHAPLLLPFVDALYKETCLGLQSNHQRCEALLYIIQTHSIAERVTPQRSLSMAQCHELHTYMRRHLQYDVHPADLAQHIGLSPDYFSRVFKRSFGKSPKRWIMEQRIAMAAYRLEQSSERIALIGQSCGYSDQNIFSRQFRQVMGCSPSQHRMRS